MQGSRHRKFTPILDGSNICLENMQAHQKMHVKILILDVFITV